MPLLSKIRFNNWRNTKAKQFASGSDRKFLWSVPIDYVEGAAHIQLKLTENTVALFALFAHMIHCDHNHEDTYYYSDEEGDYESDMEPEIRFSCPCTYHGYRYVVSLIHKEHGEEKKKIMVDKCGEQQTWCHTAHLCAQVDEESEPPMISELKYRLSVVLEKVFNIKLPKECYPIGFLKEKFFNWFSAYPKKGTLFTKENAGAGCVFEGVPFYCALLLFTYHHFEPLNPLRQPLLEKDIPKKDPMKVLIPFDVIEDNVWQNIIMQLAVLPFIDYDTEKHLNIFLLVKHRALVIKRIVEMIDHNNQVRNAIMASRKHSSRAYDAPFTDKEQWLPFSELSPKEKAMCVENRIRNNMSNSLRRFLNVFKTLSLVCKEFYRLMRTTALYKPLKLLKSKKGELVKFCAKRLDTDEEYNPEHCHYSIPRKISAKPCTLAIIEDGPLGNHFAMEKYVGEYAVEYRASLCGSVFSGSPGSEYEPFLTKNAFGGKTLLLRKELIGADYLEELNKRRTHILSDIERDENEMKNRLAYLDRKEEDLHGKMRKLEKALNKRFPKDPFLMEELSESSDSLHEKIGKKLDKIHVISIERSTILGKMGKLTEKKSSAQRIGRKLIKPTGWKMRLARPSKVVLKKRKLT